MLLPAVLAMSDAERVAEAVRRHGSHDVAADALLDEARALEERARQARRLAGLVLREKGGG
jgi:hypothetical protein